MGRASSGAGRRGDSVLPVLGVQLRTLLLFDSLFSQQQSLLALVLLHPVDVTEKKKYYLNANLILKLPLLLIFIIV